MSLLRADNTNFDNGVTNRNAADIFGSMGQLDPTKFNTYHDDFNAPIIIANELAGFTDATAGSVAAVNIEGGGIAISTGTVDTNSAVIASVSRGFSCRASSALYFRIKLSIDELTNSVMLAGLMDGVTITPSDGIFFIKADLGSTVDIVVRSGSSEIATATNIHTMVVNTQTTFEFYWDGIDRVYYGVDGNVLGFVNLAGLTLPAGFMGPTMGVISGATGAKATNVDYLFAAQER